jgi:hypothetical protein
MKRGNEVSDSLWPTGACPNQLKTCQMDYLRPSICYPSVFKTGKCGLDAAGRRIGRDRMMIIVKKQAVALFVDRSTQQWIVRDPEGNYWVVPASASAWEYRQPFHPYEGIELEPVPGHYKYMLNLPF